MAVFEMRRRKGNSKYDYDPWTNEVETNYYDAICYRGVETIKYITFVIDVYNNFGEFEKSVSDTRKGPFYPREDICSTDFCLSTSQIKIEKCGETRVIKEILVTFMHGGTAVYTAADIEDKRNNGCYIATCVYGSYDCPEVWTLRRYRDDTLASSWHGRAFIRLYYAVSPTLVKWFGETKWFKKLWRGKLDRMVAKLQQNGVENTPYKDKSW